MDGRLSKVRGRLEEYQIDALLITALPSLRYLTGFRGTSGVALVKAEEAIFITDFRYQDQVKEEVVGLQVKVAEDDPLLGLRDFSLVRKGDKIGFEAEALTVDQLQGLKDLYPEVDFIPIKGLVETLRIVKEPEEVKAIRRAAELAGVVFAEVLDYIKPGVMEREVAAEVEYRLKRRGSETIPFDTIVASGERGAMPHATAGERRICPGDLVVLDLGAVCDGYASDMTRTVVVGPPSRKQWKVYHLVVQAQRVAMDYARAGIGCAELDARARDLIAEAGYGPNFGHSLGHGVGLEVHEAPRISSKSKLTLQAGMVVTIEPGVYIPGWGGIRVEDVVHITENGCEIITSVSRELISV